MSDLATINAAGSYTSVGWGSIEQSAADRSLTEDWQYTVSGQTDLGKWLPAQVKLTAPFYYSRSKSTTTPKYDPYNEDLLVEETLDSYSTEREKDSIRDLIQTVDKTTSMSLSGVKFNVKSKHPMPWDPANISMSYSQNRKRAHDPTTEYEHDDNYKASINYQWSPYFKPWKPFEEKKGNNAKKSKPKKIKEDETEQPQKKALKPQASNKKKQKLLTDFQLNWLPNSISLSSNWNRTYHEEQLRNVETYESDYTIPVTYSKTFTWMRQTAISWDLTKTIKLNFNSATNARIDEPDAPVNKNLYPDEFEAWKDTIGMQLWKLGTPVSYNQTFDATWNIPISSLTYTDWITATAKYKGTYEWQRGTVIDEDTETGGTLQNQGSYQGDLKFNFEKLYNKSPFLKKANDRFKTKTTTRSTARKAPAKKTPAKKPKEFKQTLTLKGDTTLTLKHGLNTKRLIISAKNAETGKVYNLKGRKTDANNIRFHLKDSMKLDLSIKADKPLDDLKWYKNTQAVARFLMMVRSANVSYRYKLDTYLPSYKLNAGDFYGQNGSRFGLRIRLRRRREVYEQSHR